jgi:EF hand
MAKKENMKMKTRTKVLSGLLALGVSGWMLTAQDSGSTTPNDQGTPPNEGPGPEGPRFRRLPPPPLFAALDANHDGVIDETEIANASAALRTLDKNGDGKLTMDELMPPRLRPGEGLGRLPGPPPDGEQPPKAR